MKKYHIVYADPPWDHQLGGYSPKSPEAKYPVMTTSEICALPVKDIAHNDAVLFLWVTMTKLPDAFAVIEAWGFKYVSNGFTWVKTNPKGHGYHFGMGYWTRQNAEICLVAKRGRPKRRSAAVSSIVVAPRGVHSAKPAIVRREIVRVCGNLSRVELFARTKTPGWDIWGNELPNDLELTL